VLFVFCISSRGVFFTTTSSSFVREREPQKLRCDFVSIDRFAKKLFSSSLFCDDDGKEEAD